MKARNLLAAGQLEDALAAAEQAIEKHSESFSEDVGTRTRWYLPYFVRGQIYLELDRHREAKADFEAELKQGVIQGNVTEFDQFKSLEATIDATPPAFENIQAEFLSSEFQPRDGREIEVAKFIFRGQVVEARSLKQVELEYTDILGVAQRAPVATEKVRSVEGRYSFEVEVTLDPEGAIRLFGVDGVGNKGEHAVDNGLPDVDLASQVSRVHAVIVGVNHYARPHLAADRVQCRQDLRLSCNGRSSKCYRFADLKSAATDAASFSQFLRRRGVPSGNIQTLISDGSSQDAVHDKVLGALKRLAKVEADEVIFYFAGHGLHSDTEGNLLLLTDTQAFECNRPVGEKRSPLEESALGVNRIQEILSTSRAEERYVLLDACRTEDTPAVRGAADEPPPPELPSFRGLKLRSTGSGAAPPKQPVIFYATLDGRPSIESKVYDGGYFTRFLMQGLRQRLNLEDLQRWVQTRVSRETVDKYCKDKQDAGCALRQVPHIEWPTELLDMEVRRRTFMLGDGTP